VDQVRLDVTHRPGQGAAAPCQVTLTDRKSIDEVTAWLRGVDWSQRGEDVAAIKLPEPDLYLRVRQKGGTEEEFAIYWDGKVIRGGRLLRTDVTGLKPIVQKVCP
jgi:hypothetical protein